MANFVIARRRSHNGHKKMPVSPVCNPLQQRRQQKHPAMDDDDDDDCVVSTPQAQKWNLTTRRNSRPCTHKLKLFAPFSHTHAGHSHFEQRPPHCLHLADLQYTYAPDRRVAYEFIYMHGGGSWPNPASWPDFISHEPTTTNA